MRSAVLFYFSGTGHTAFCANEIAESFKKAGLSLTVYSIEEISCREIKGILRKASHIGFGYPVYGGDLPRPMIEFLIRFPKTRDKTVFSFCTQQSSFNYGTKRINQLLSHAKTKVRFSESFTIPDNAALNRCEITFADTENSELPAIQAKAATFVRAVLQDKAYKPKRSFRFHSFLKKPVFFFKYRRMQKSLSIDRNACTKCMECKKLCPVDNIILLNNQYSMGKECCACLRCHSFCPQGAILFQEVRTQPCPDPGMQNYKDKILELPNRIIHNKSVLKVKKRLFRDKYGRPRKEFFLVASVILLLIGIDTWSPSNPSEFEVFLRELLIFFILSASAIMCPFWYISKVIKRGRGEVRRSRVRTPLSRFGSALFCCFAMFYFSYLASNILKDLSAEPVYETAMVQEIKITRYSRNMRRGANTHSRTEVSLNTRTGRYRYLLRGPNSLKVGERYLFRLMHNSETAIYIGPAPQ